MNLKIKAKWVAALRSGGYKQGAGRLRNFHSEFCCLGVLCDLYDSSLWDEKCEFLGEKCVLPHELVRWSGLRERKVEIRGIGYLTEHNDDGRTFDEIADAIEEQL